MKLQTPGKSILIGSWRKNEDYGIYPVGSKPKRLVFCPVDDERLFLIPGHSYLFKIPQGWKAQQTWSEIVAYQVGCIVGVDVPPAFLAYDETTNEIGVLVEFFYNYPGEKLPIRFIHGIELIRRYHTADANERPHHVKLNIALCRTYGIPGHIEWWGRLLTFDALIGNTDRHTENWGILFQQGPGASSKTSMAPAFDNGTSLAFQQTNPNVLKKSGFMDRFISDGSHHCGFSANSDHPTPHVNLCQSFYMSFPQARGAMREILEFDESQMRDTIYRNICGEISVPFTADRAEFVTEVILARRARLIESFGG